MDFTKAPQTTSARQRCLVIAALMTVACMTRIWIIRRIAVNVPYWDQWDSEIVGLYHKVLAHTLTFADLWLPANEHRILLTRLMDLALFYVDHKQMNTVHAMCVQACIGIASLGIVLGVLNRSQLFFAHSLLVTALFMLPISWENIFWSYQSQVYFAIFFAVLAALIAARPTVAFWPAVACTLVAGATMASGMFTGVMITLAYCMHAFETKRFGGLGKAAFFVLLAAGIGYATPHNPGHDVLRVTNPIDFVHNVWRFCTWPSVPYFWVGLLPWCCAGVYFGRWLCRRQRLAFEQRFALLLMAWVAMSCVAAAYARSGSIANRYLEYLVLAYVASVLLCARDMAQRATPVFDALWFGLVLSPMACVTVMSLLDAATQLDRRRTFACQVRRALQVGQSDPAAAYAILANPPGLGFPDTRRLAEIVVDPRTRHILRFMLPPEPAAQD